MIANFEVTGQWWVPGNPAAISTGTLTFSPESGAKLINVIGPLAATHPNPGPGPQLLNGRASDGNFYTIAYLYCSSTHSFIPTAAFNVALVIISRHFESLETIRFSRFDWEYSNLHYWVGNRGSVAVEHEPRVPGTLPVRDRHIVTVEYPPLWDVTFNGVRFRYFNRSSSNNDLLHGRVAFTAREGLRLDFPNETPLTEAYRLERAFRGFVDLLCHAQIQRAKLAAGPTYSIEILDLGRMGRNGKQDPEQQRIPIEFDQIQAEINPILERWLAIYTNLEPSLSLFFLGLHDRELNIENVFLGIMQALEAFHRSLFPGQFVPEQDFEDTILPPMLASIPTTIEADFRQSLRSRLRFGNERSLRSRLNGLIQSLPATATFEEYREPALISRSVDTRNSFTHVITEAANVYGPGELYRAVQLWQEILTALILMRLGISAPIVEGAVEILHDLRGTFYEA